MKRIGMIVACCLFAVVGAVADSYTYEANITNTQHITYSDAIPVSGWLDKIEFSQDAAATTTVTVATYDGTTAVDTLASKAVSSTTQIFRPRVIGTTYAGVDIAAVVGSGSDALTNLVTTGLSAPYERILIGGNTKIALTGTANGGTNSCKVVVYYERLAK